MFSKHIPSLKVKAFLITDFQGYFLFNNHENSCLSVIKADNFPTWNIHISTDEVSIIPKAQKISVPLKSIHTAYQGQQDLDDNDIAYFKKSVLKNIVLFGYQVKLILNKYFENLRSLRLLKKTITG
jgi:hypothetical protein